MTTKKYTPYYFAYVLLVALAGTGLLAFLTLFPREGLGFDWASFLMFTVLAFAAKFMSFRVMGVVTLSMDTAVYTTCLLSMGEVPAAWSVFLSIYVKSLWDTVVRLNTPGAEQRPFLEDLFGGPFVAATGAFGIVAAGYFLPVAAFVHGSVDRTWQVLWLAPAASALFVLVQYGLVLQKYSLLGFAWLDLFKSALLPGLLAESIMVPLAMVMVLTFHSYGTVSPPFGVLVATYLIVNFIFKKMSDARSRLHEKVQDLQALNALGRSICSTLQTENLITLLGRETLTLLAEADAVMLYLWRDESTSFETFVEHRGALPSPGFSPDIARALAERTVRERQPFSTMAVGEKGALVTEAAGRVLTGRSYMGIPVEVYDQTIGVIVVFSNREAQFGASRLELLQLIGQQAAVALQNSRLYVLATVDGLTKLYVRRYFDHRLHEESARAKRYGSAFSLLLLDFDDFKGINDTHGHSTGDKVLVSVASTILSMLRSMDVPARFGGDEFAILLPQVDLEGARVVAQRLMQRIRAERVRVGDEWLAPTVSIGVSTFPRHVAEDGPDILGAADAALYAAKNGGKSRVCVYGE